MCFLFGLFCVFFFGLFCVHDFDRSALTKVWFQRNVDRDSGLWIEDRARSKSINTNKVLLECFADTLKLSEGSFYIGTRNSHFSRIPFMMASANKKKMIPYVRFHGLFSQRWKCLGSGCYVVYCPVGAKRLNTCCFRKAQRFILQLKIKVG